MDRIDFSDFKDHPEKLQRTGVFGNLKRIGHSASGSTFWQSEKGEKAFAVVDKTTTYGGGALAVAGVVGVGALAVGTGGMLVAAIPIVVALGLLVRDKYSNRDAHHESLAPCVFSLIDDKNPKINITDVNNGEVMEKASSDALYLMQEGPQQYKDMGQKLKTAQEKYDKFIKDYFTLLAPLVKPLNQEWPGTKLINEARPILTRYPNPNLSQQGYAAVGGKENYAKLGPLFDLYQACVKAGESAAPKWDKAIHQNGEVWEYLRRLVHAGNYIQCAAVINYATMKKVSPGLELKFEDPFDNTNLGKIRAQLKEHEKIINGANDNYAELAKLRTDFPNWFK